MSTITKAAWYEKDALPEPEIYDPGSTPCPCCGYSANSWSTEAYMDGNVQGDEWAVCNITSCRRCQYSPERWDGTEADWLKQADEYRKGWLQELSDTLIDRSNAALKGMHFSSESEGPGAVVNAALEQVRELANQLWTLACKLDTFEGCQEVANNES